MSINEWNESFQQFNIQGSPNFPLSPPHSAKVSQHEQPSRLAIPSGDDIFGPLLGPTAENNSASSSNQSASFLRKPNQFILPDRSLSLQPSAPAPDFAFGSSDPWTSTGGFDPLFDEHHETPSAVQPQHVFDSLDPSLAASGLMIDCNPFDSLTSGDGGAGQPGGGSTGGGSSFADALAAANHARFATNRTRQPALLPDPISSPPAPGASPPRRARPTVVTGLPRGGRRRSGSASPGPSPTRAAPPTTPTPTPRRHRSTPCFASPQGGSSTRIARPPRTPRTPRTPKAGVTSPGGSARTPGGASGGGKGAVGFVNFTVDDSTRILSGVAPSGSSKTKAKREREAHEKSRQLSEVAERLVREAGGDPGRLRGFIARNEDE